MEPYKCDDLVLGSSPASLLEALLLAKQGRHVVIAEAGKDIGGVWSSVRIGDETFTDQAPHLIDARPGAYDFLTEELGIELVDVTTDSYVAFGMPIFDRHLYPYTEYWLHKMCGGDNKRIYRAWSNAGHTQDVVKAQVEELCAKSGAIEDRGSKIMYFKGGTAAFISRLLDLLDQYRVEIFTNRPILRAESDGLSGRLIGVAPDLAISATSIVTNGHAFPEAMVRNGECTILERQRRDAHSLFLTLAQNTARPFFYALFPESSLIHLAADASYGTDCVGPAERVIVVTLHNSGLVQYGGSAAVYHDIVKELCDSGLISWSSRLVSAAVHSVHRASLDDNAMARLAELDGVRVVDSRGGLDRCLAAHRTLSSKLAA